MNPLRKLFGKPLSAPPPLPKPPVTTRWGCLAIPIILTLLIVWGHIQDVRYENQPPEVHLRDIFYRIFRRIRVDFGMIRSACDYRNARSSPSSSERVA